MKGGMKSNDRMFASSCSSSDRITLSVPKQSLSLDASVSLPDLQPTTELFFLGGSRASSSQKNASRPRSRREILYQPSNKFNLHDSLRAVPNFSATRSAHSSLTRLSLDSINNSNAKSFSSFNDSEAPLSETGRSNNTNFTEQISLFQRSDDRSVDEYMSRIVSEAATSRPPDDSTLDNFDNLEQSIEDLSKIQQSFLVRVNNISGWIISSKNPKMQSLQLKIAESIAYREASVLRLQSLLQLLDKHYWQYAVMRIRVISAERTLACEELVIAKNQLFALQETVSVALAHVRGISITILEAVSTLRGLLSKEMEAAANVSVFMRPHGNYLLKMSADLNTLLDSCPACRYWLGFIPNAMLLPPSYHEPKVAWKAYTTPLLNHFVTGRKEKLQRERRAHRGGRKNTVHHERRHVPPLEQQSQPQPQQHQQSQPGSAREEDIIVYRTGSGSASPSPRIRSRSNSNNNDYYSPSPCLLQTPSSSSVAAANNAIGPALPALPSASSSTSPSPNNVLGLSPSGSSNAIAAAHAHMMMPSMIVPSMISTTTSAASPRSSHNNSRGSPTRSRPMTTALEEWEQLRDYCSHSWTKVVWSLPHVHFDDNGSGEIAPLGFGLSAGSSNAGSSSTSLQTTTQRRNSLQQTMRKHSSSLTLITLQEGPKWPPDCGGLAAATDLLPILDNSPNDIQVEQQPETVAWIQNAVLNHNFWSDFDHNPFIVEAALGFQEAFPTIYLVPQFPPELRRTCEKCLAMLEKEVSMHRQLEKQRNEAEKLRKLHLQHLHPVMNRNSLSEQLLQERKEVQAALKLRQAGGPDEKLLRGIDRSALPLPLSIANSLPTVFEHDHNHNEEKVFELTTSNSLLSSSSSQQQQPALPVTSSLHLDRIDLQNPALAPFTIESNPHLRHRIEASIQLDRSVVSGGNSRRHDKQRREVDRLTLKWKEMHVIIIQKQVRILLAKRKRRKMIAALRWKRTMIKLQAIVRGFVTRLRRVRKAHDEKMQAFLVRKEAIKRFRSAIVISRAIRRVVNLKRLTRNEPLLFDRVDKIGRPVAKFFTIIALRHAIYHRHNEAPTTPSRRTSTRDLKLEKEEDLPLQFRATLSNDDDLNQSQHDERQQFLQSRDINMSRLTLPGTRQLSMKPLTIPSMNRQKTLTSLVSDGLSESPTAHNLNPFLMHGESSSSSRQDEGDSHTSANELAERQRRLRRQAVEFVRRINKDRPPLPDSLRTSRLLPASKQLTRRQSRSLFIEPADNDSAKNKPVIASPHDAYLPPLALRKAELVRLQRLEQQRKLQRQLDGQSIGSIDSQGSSSLGSSTLATLPQKQRLTMLMHPPSHPELKRPPALLMDNGEPRRSHEQRKEARDAHKLHAVLKNFMTASF